MFWASLVAKMLTSAAVVVAASFVVERTGPLVGAMVATLPLSAGPAYLFLALDHDGAFLRQSAIASLAAIAATGIFILVYAAAAQTRGTAASLGASLAAWLVAAFGLSAVHLSLVEGLVLNLVLFPAAMAWAGRSVPRTAALRRQGRLSDVFVRAGTVMTLVAAVVLAGRTIGPAIAGLLALAPIVMTSLVIILQPRIGGRATATVMVHSLPGMMGFAAAMGILASTVERLGSMSALGLALATSCAWNGGILAVKSGGGGSAGPDKQPGVR
jgi:uncharacterized membrane protein (GlpM family)